MTKGESTKYTKSVLEKIRRNRSINQLNKDVDQSNNQLTCKSDQSNNQYDKDSDQSTNKLATK